MTRAPERHGPSGAEIAESVLLTPLRLALGGLFVFAAYLKLRNPQEFVNTVKAFDVFDLEAHRHVIVMTAFGVPWAELICGLLLILGLFARPAALLLSAQLVVFIGAIVSVVARGLEVKCGCFGDYEWPCQGAIGACHIYRNLALLAVALLLTWRGAGLFSLDRLLTRRRAPRPLDSGAPDA